MIDKALTVREITEQREFEILSKYAQKAVDSKGSIRQRSVCDYRTCYQRDRDRILHSDAFRRLMHKTQVFLNPEDDQYTTRLTHTLEVSQIARTISRALFLNEDLTEAIALGHDLGHTPFGHAGERALNSVTPFKFLHAEQSVRVLQKIEKKGRGLNITKETLDGIISHSKGGAETLEGQVVYYSDKIAYMNHDLDDALRAKILTFSDLPKEIVVNLGKTKSERITTFIDSIVRNSNDKIEMDERTSYLFFFFRKFMFNNVFTSSKAKEEEHKAELVVKRLYNYYLKNTEELPKNYRVSITEEEFSKERSVADYISEMSDRSAISDFERLFIPKSWY